MNSGTVNSGFVTNRPNRLCRAFSSRARGTPAAPLPRGRVRRASVTGAAISRNSGVISDSTMCCVMCTLNSTML
jgi:hypothetical protein